MIIVVDSDLLSVIQHIQSKLPPLLVSFEEGGRGALLMPRPVPDVEPTTMPVHVFLYGNDLGLGSKSGDDPFTDAIVDAISDFVGDRGELRRDHGIDLPREKRADQ